MTTTITLTTIEILKIRKAGWSDGWQAADNWRDQHIDDERPARMPDYTRGEYEVENFIDVTEEDCVSEYDEFSRDLWQAYVEAVETILDDAANSAWNEFRDQHCDEDNCLVRDE